MFFSTLNWASISGRLRFVVAIGLASVACAQTAALRGEVSAPDGTPIPDAVVRATRLATAPRNAVTTGTGEYSLDDLAAGGYTVQVEARGFRHLDTQVDLSPGSNRLDLKLDFAAATEVVTVTAQKREEALMESPTSVTALSADQVATDGLTQLRELPDVVPNFRITDTGGRATFSYITMRGFINTSVAIDTAAVVYVDGVPFGDFYSMNQSLFDVERIEVVKGPQSTLYGVNNEAGVVNIYSKRPGDSLHGSITGSIGSYMSHDTVATLSGPLIRNKLYASIAASVDGRDGFIHNLYTNHQYDDQFGYAGRSRVVWNPTTRWDIVGTVFVNRVDDKGGYLYMPTNLAAYSALPGVNGRSVGPFDILLDNEGFNRGTTTAQALQVTHFGNHFDLIYTGAHRQAIQHYGFDADLTPIPAQNGRVPSRFYEWNDELRLQSPQEQASRLQWTLGFSTNQLERRQETILEALPANFFGLPAGQYHVNNSQLTSRNYGTFGQGTYRWWKNRLGATFGLRYDRVDRDLNRKPDDFGFPGLIASASNDIWLPKATIDLRAGKGALLYVTAGRGWRAGGLSPFAPTPATTPYRPEKSWTYEGGVKATAWNNRLSTTLAVFDSDVHDFHDQIFVGPLLAYLGNARDVTLKGADVDFSLRPLRTLEFTGSIGLTSARYDDYLYDIASGLRFDGRRIRQVPNYDYNFAAHYRFPHWPLFLRAELSGIGNYKDYKVDLSSVSVQEFTFGDYTVVNLRAGYDARRWSVIGYVNNLANRAYFANTETGYGLSLYQAPVGIRGAPRVAGIRVTLHF